jgi:Predicted membrane protein (DUF2142)
MYAALAKTPKRFVLFWIAVFAAAATFVICDDFSASLDRRVSISLMSDQPGGLQVFFDHGGGFAETDSGRFDFPAGSSIHSIALTDGLVKAFRVDPDPSVSKIQLDKVVIQQPSVGQSAEVALEALRPFNEIVSIERSGSSFVVTTQPGALDPQLMLPVDDPLRPPAWERIAGRTFQGLLLFALGIAVAARLSRPPTGVPVPALLFGTWLLVGAMALTSTTRQSVHPDEFSHVSAAQYYFNHWLPPAVDAPEIADTYSAYGASYLNELDVVYLVAAKSSHIWSGFGLDATTTLRLFNVCLFGVLLAVAWIRPSVRPAAIVLLLTPQIWYIFSYFNADAFAFFLSLLATMLFAAIDSPVSRFVEGERVSRIALGIFVVSLGLLLISKRNYIPVVFATALLLAVRHLGVTVWTSVVCAVGVGLLMFRLIAGNALVYMFPSVAAWFVPTGLILLVAFAVVLILRVVQRSELRPRLYRLACLFILASLVALPRIVVDVSENGWPAQKSLQMSMAAENFAEPPFKPSTLRTNPDASYPGLYLASKGTTLGQIVGEPHEWLAISWYSMLGMYGYMSIAAPPFLYSLLSFGMLVLSFAFLRWAFTHPEARVNLVVAVVGVALVALASVLNSWASDFQAQGRYLLPSFPIAAAYLLSQPALASSRLVSGGASVCFLGSVFSFVGVALPALAGH